MKRIYYLIIALIVFIPQIVWAAPNATIGVSANSIENGKTVTATVTVTETASWNVRITGSGAASCSQKFADVTSDAQNTTKKFTLSCKATSEGTITFSVTGDITNAAGQTKIVSSTKTVTVTKPKSTDNNLSDLKVDGVTVAGFASNKTSYTLKDNSGTSINITATASDTKASVSGTGTKTLNYGKNTYNVVVTAENGAKRTYTIIINKPDPRSKNNYLASLTVDKGTIEFNKNTTSYLIKLEHDVENITINAQAEDSKARVDGTGTKTLQDYINEFKINVTAENGSVRTYLVKVARKDAKGDYGNLSADNTVKSIVITDHPFNFDKDLKNYNILVEELEKEVEVIVEPNDSSAAISIDGITDLKPGLNKASVKVIAENGDISEYTFNLYKLGEKEEIKEEKETTGLNIWMIIAIIEAIVIIGLVALILLKIFKKK